MKAFFRKFMIFVFVLLFGISGKLHAFYYDPIPFEALSYDFTTTGATGLTSAFPVALFGSAGAALVVSVAGSILAYVYIEITESASWHQTKKNGIWRSSLVREDVLAYLQDIQANAHNYLTGAQVGEEFYELIDFMDDYPNLEGLSNEAKAQLILGLDPELINQFMDQDI